MANTGEATARLRPTAAAAAGAAPPSRRLLLLLVMGALSSWCYRSLIRPPPSRICGAPGGPPITAPRIALRDGRNLAYKEAGIAKDKAQHKIIFVHGSGSSRHGMPAISPEVLEELSVYMVAYDRAGYGQSDPHPGRDVKSEMYDVEDLADALELGQEFYLMTFSIGGYTAWSCLNYIPHRLAGVVMLAPVTNFWWPGIPPAEALQAFSTQAIGDKLALLVAHYAPSLLYFWMTQKWLPTSSTMRGLEQHCNSMDRQVLRKMSAMPAQIRAEAMQQGIFESKIRDKMVAFGNWGFDPSDVKDPFPSKNGSVHLYHGDQDYLVPVILQRYVHRSLPWIHYHEIPGAGHLILYGVPGLAEKALRCLLTRQHC